MWRGNSETPRTVSPCPSNLWSRAAVSKAAHTAPSPGRDIAADAYATAPPDVSGSFSVSLPGLLECRDLFILSLDRSLATSHHSPSLPHVTLTIRPMRILDRYIVREVVRHAILGLLIFTFVLFVPKLVRLMELFVRHSGSGSQVALLFLCIVPSILIFTIPMAVLIGVLLGLGRMSMDSEIIAITALGISRKRILLPVGVLAVLGAALTLLMTIFLAPRSLRAFRDIEADLITSQISFQVQPRVFDERFPHMVLYVNDVSASGTRWNGVFIFE